MKKAWTSKDAVFGISRRCGETPWHISCTQSIGRACWHTVCRIFSEKGPPPPHTHTKKKSPSHVVFFFFPSTRSPAHSKICIENGSNKKTKRTVIHWSHHEHVIKYMCPLELITLVKCFAANANSTYVRNYTSLKTLFQWRNCLSAYKHCEYI